jgi:site-specific DNA-cytosine methylase
VNVVAHPEPVTGGLNVISLCTGGAGLDLGLELAVGRSRVVCMVEREAFAVAHLVEAMRQGLLAQAPIWSDVRTFAGRPWRGLVDGLIGGIPCQPHSLAGKRLGTDDERDLWGDARRIIGQARPWFVLIENVGGMLSSGGAERVIGDLRRLGYQVEVGLFSAAEVGASHERQRVFILAVADRARLGFGGWPGSGTGVAPGCGWPDLNDARGELADAGCRDQQRRRGSGDLPSPAGSAEGARHQRQRHGYAAGDGCEALAVEEQLADAAGERRRSERTSGGPEQGRRSSATRRLQSGRLGSEVRGPVADANGSESPLDLRLGEHLREECAAAAGICRPVDDAPRLGDRSITVRQGNPDKPVLTLQGQAQAMPLARSLPDQPISTVGEESSHIRRTLNPLFVEWLMGWPPGWTSLALTPPASSASGSWGMESYLFKQRMRSALFALGLPQAAPSAQLNLFG